MKKKFLFLFLLLVITILNSCSNQKQKASGPEDQITVIADSTEYLKLEPTLKKVFGKVIYTPQREQLFHLKQYNTNHLKDIGRTKNVIIIAPLNSGSYTSKYINSLIDSTVKAKVENDSAFVFNKYDLWSENQLVMVLTSSTIEQLKKNMLNNADDLLYYFQNASDKRLMTMLYHQRYEQKNIESRFLKKYGFIIYVNSDFQLAKDIEEDNFIWLRRAPNSDRERWIFVHWIENSSPSLMVKDSILKIRNEITKKFYQGADENTYVETVDDYLTTKEVDYNGRYAIMTTGLWQMNDVSLGGPFISYTFYDEKTQRLYMIDGSLYAPKYYKRNMLQQVDVLLRSWIPEYELSKERKENILNELPDSLKTK